jgi:methylphosphotriester-DNA--protein-cysteine methyltransferase
MDTHNMLPTQAEMWQAVTSNDTTYDDRFVYAVKSTGIYCRPSCKSRDPKPENIAYYATPSDAREAGFRACKRCQPDNATTDQQERVQGMCEYIAANLDGDLSLDALAAVFSLSPYHLQRTFKAAVGLSPKQYADTLRMERFKDHLREGDSVTDAIYQAGYGSSSRLYERVSEELGMTPTDYQRGGDQQTLFYTTAPCALGVLMVAATERGLCAVRLGHSANALVVELADEFDGATCLPDETRLTDGRQRHPELHRRRDERHRPAARHQGDGLPAPGVGRAAADSLRRNALLWRGGGGHRAADRITGRRQCLRQQPGRAGGPVPSCGEVRRGDGQLSLGD